MSATLDGLLQRSDIWRAGKTGYNTSALPTGFAELDAQLAGSGWPHHALTEIEYAHDGIGELRLLLPALVSLSQQQRWVTWIAPPYIPYAPALASAGVNLARVLLVHPRTRQEALWATEQALRSGTCSAVLAWLQSPDDRALRRLQLATEAGESWGVFFNRHAGGYTNSPAALRLRLEPVLPRGLAIRILKQRGGWPTGPLFLNP
jgi:cell division inhibitor SulA/protein ImuA